MIQGGGVRHPDTLYAFANPGTSLGFSRNLWESSFTLGTTTSTDNKAYHMQNESTTGWANNVFRLNVWDHLGSGAHSTYDTNAALLRTRVYNNDHVNCVRANNQTQSTGCGFFSPNTTATALNNLFYQAWADVLTSGIQVLSDNNSGNLTLDYNLAYDPDGSVTFITPWTGQSHAQSNVNPQLHNVPGDDFTLDSGSGARGVGGPLTTATSCSGTTLNLASNGGALFFGSDVDNLSQYSGNLVPGDTITVGTSTTRTVVSISGDALALDSPLSCSNGDPVYFGSSSTIDIGAYPYNAGGYTLTAGYSRSDQSVIVTPSDASLVRFVVCYEDGIPTTVDSSAPFTCSVGSGSLDVRVYPRYASKTLWVTAGQGPGGSTSTAATSSGASSTGASTTSATGGGGTSAGRVGGNGDTGGGGCGCRVVGNAHAGTMAYLLVPMALAGLARRRRYDRIGTDRASVHAINRLSNLNDIALNSAHIAPAQLLAGHRPPRFASGGGCVWGSRTTSGRISLRAM